MTVGELKELLEDLPDNAEVRLAHQPRWPFELSVGKCAYVENDEDAEMEKPEDAEDDEDDDPPQFDGNPGIFYIGDGGQVGYLPGNVASELGWK